MTLLGVGSGERPERLVGANDHVIARDHPDCARVNDTLRKAGYRVEELRFDAVPSTGGSFRCATLPLNRAPG